MKLLILITLLSSLAISCSHVRKGKSAQSDASVKRSIANSDFKFFQDSYHYYEKDTKNDKEQFANEFLNTYSVLLDGRIQDIQQASKDEYAMTYLDQMIEDLASIQITSENLKCRSSNPAGNSLMDTWNFFFGKVLPVGDVRLQLYGSKTVRVMCPVIVILEDRYMKTLRSSPDWKDRYNEKISDVKRRVRILEESATRRARR